MAAAPTLVVLGLALPLAVLNSRYEFRGRMLFSSLLLVPMVLPPFVGALGTRLLLGRFGPLTILFGDAHGPGVDWLGSLRIFGVVAVEALALYPIILLNLQAALAKKPQIEVIVVGSKPGEGGEPSELALRGEALSAADATALRAAISQLQARLDKIETSMGGGQS